MKGPTDPIPEEEADDIDPIKSRVPVRQNEEKAMYLLAYAVRRKENYYHSKTSKSKKQN